MMINELIRVSVMGNKYVSVSPHLKRSTFFALGTRIEAQLVALPCPYLLALNDLSFYYLNCQLASIVVLMQY